MDPTVEILSALRARDATWMQRRRKLDTALLFTLLVQKRGNRSSVADALLALQLNDRANLREYVPCRATPAAVTQALAKLPADTFKSVHEELVQHAAVQWLLAQPHPRAPMCIAVDGCQLRIPPAMSHLREGCAPSTTPHLLLTCAVDCRTDTILTYDVSFQPDERAALLRLLRSGRIPGGSCILADRGYFSAAVWQELHALGMFAVFRVKKSACNAVRAALGERRAVASLCPGNVPSRIAVWSREHDGDLEAGLPCSPLQRYTLQHMLHAEHTAHLRYEPVADDCFLLTNTLLPRATLVKMYICRWRIETVHRTVQSGGMGLGKPRGGRASIMHTIQAACLEHLALRILELQATRHTRSQRSRGRQHKAWKSQSSTKHHHQFLLALVGRLGPVPRPQTRQPQPQAQPPPHIREDTLLLAYEQADAMRRLYTWLVGDVLQMLLTPLNPGVVTAGHLQRLPD